MKNLKTSFFSIDKPDIVVKKKAVLKKAVYNSLPRKKLTRQIVKLGCDRLNKSTLIIYEGKIFGIENLPDGISKYSDYKEHKNAIMDFNEYEPVKDSCVGLFTKVNKTTWGFRKENYFIERKIRGKKIEVADSNEYKKYKRLILVLDSPHRNEYDKHKQPIYPAQGTTGEQVKEKLGLKIIENNREIDEEKSTKKKDKVKIVLEDKEYIVLLINPIQYPASCFDFLDENDNIKLKDLEKAKLTHYVFEALFSEEGANLRKDFKERLKEYYRNNKDVIINCAIRWNKEIVKEAIEEAIKEKFTNQKVKIYDLTHPSSWVYEKNV